MIFIWGKKLVYRKLGYVADFCPICRTPQAFEVQRVGLAGHVYFVSLGEGELAGFQRKCCECAIALDAKPTQYASIAEALRPLPQLTAQTFPHLSKAYATILALEERVKATPSSLSPQERYALIRNPMLLLSPRVEKRYASTHIDLQTAITFLGVLVAIFAESAVVSRFAPDHASESIIGMCLLGVILVAWQIALSNTRFIRRSIVPVLAKTLRPLKPTEAEVQAALAELAKLRHKLGRKLKPRDLMTDLG
jgi:hypothetical protein